MKARHLWAVGAQLGEGPVWLPDEGALRFVDIKSGALHRFDPSTGEGETLRVGGKPSFILPATGGRLIVGSGDRIHVLEDGRLGAVIARVGMPAHNRTNDATVDSAGRLWFGTMDDNEEHPTGAIYRLEGSQAREQCGRCVVTNGPAVSPDGRVLYRVDSGGRTIWRHAMDADGLIDAGEVFVTITEGEGFPDGVTVDAEGCLWVALWDGWAVRRYAPDGTQIARVALPCARVTKIAFGGDDLRTAFVTTARVGLSESELIAQPLAGGLFAFDAPAPGVRTPPIRLD